MARLWTVIILGLVCAGALTFSAQADNTWVKGDYVEVRTASVFAGACHFNGEVTTTGRDAMLAWNVSSGRWNGVDLAGVRAIAVVSAEDNLSNLKAGRRSELIIDQSTTQNQASAMVDALKKKYADALGEVISVRTAPIN